MEYEKTWHLFTSDGKEFWHAETDTIFINSIPHLVFEWEVHLDGSEKPAHSPVRLEPSKHHILGWEGCKYMYELPVDDPRKIDL